MLKKLNKNRYCQIIKFSWRLDLFQKFERKERLLGEKGEEDAKEIVEVSKPIQ